MELSRSILPWVRARFMLSAVQNIPVLRPRTHRGPSLLRTDRRQLAPSQPLESAAVPLIGPSGFPRRAGGRSRGKPRTLRLSTLACGDTRLVRAKNKDRLRASSFRREQPGHDRRCHDLHRRSAWVSGPVLCCEPRRSKFGHSTICQPPTVLCLPQSADAPGLQSGKVHDLI